MAIRLVRLLRVMKLVKSIPGLYVVVAAVMAALTSVSYVLVLLFLALYVYGVLACSIFGKNDVKHFGSLDRALCTLFRVVTLDNWDTLMYIQSKGCNETYTPMEKEVFGCEASHGSACCCC